MKRNILLLACLLSTLLPAMAQVRLTGTLTDSLGTVIDKESTVTLVTKNNMLKVAQGTVSQGRFTVEYAPQDTTDYLLYVFALGYKDRYIDVTRKTGNLGNIRLSPLSVALQEVIVRPGRLQHDIVNGNDVFRIAGTDLAQEHSVTSMLRRLPGVMVMNDQVTVVGAGAPVFTINGEAPRPGEMEAITPDRIEEVVINTMPSAKYSAKVGSVIDLKLKKRLSDYLSAYVSNSMKASSEVFMDNLYTHVNVSGKKLSTFLGYHYGYNNVKSSSDYLLEMTRLPDGTSYIQENRTKEGLTNMDWANGLTVSPKYQINDKSYVDVVYSLSLFKGNGTTESNMLRRVETNGVEIQRDESGLHDWGGMHRDNHNLAARYVYAFSPTDKLTLNAGVTRNKATNEEDVDETLNGVTDNTRGNRVANSKTFSANVDYQARLWKKLTVNVGGNYSYLTSDNQNVYDDGLNNNALVEGRERTATGYVNVSQTSGKFFYSLGLRGEYQNLTTDYHGLDRSDKKHDFYLVPKVGLNYRPSNAFSVNLSYDYSRYNPSAVDLDPTAYYENKYMYRVGNPDLKPSETHGFGLRMNHLPTGLTLAANYDYTRNAMRDVYLNDEDNPQVIKRIRENHDASTLDVTLSYYRRWGIYTLNCNGVYNQEFVKALYMGKKKNYSKPSFYVYAMNQFSLPKGFSVNMTLSYFSRKLSFPQELKPSWSAYCEVSYTHKNLTLSLDGSFRRSKSVLNQQYAYLYRYHRSDIAPEQFTFSILYRINKFVQWFRGNSVNSEAVRRSISAY